MRIIFFSLFFVSCSLLFSSGNQDRAISIDAVIENELFNDLEKVPYKKGQLPIIESLFNTIEHIFVSDGDIVGFEYTDDFDVYYGYGLIEYKNNFINEIRLYIPMYNIYDKNPPGGYDYKISIFKIENSRLVIYKPTHDELFIFENNILIEHIKHNE